jgi:glycerol-3-phosphate acyltransferase PlsY
MITTAFLLALAGYFLASIPFGYLIAKRHSLDIREEGSHNIGATNLGRVLKQHHIRGAKAWGLLCLVLDTSKGFFPVWFYLSLVDSASWVALVALATVAGHLWTPFLGFRGGKGVATTLGVILALNWMVALGCWLLAMLIKLVCRQHSERVAISSTAGVWVASLAMVWLWSTGSMPAEYAAIVTTLALIITLKHGDNFKRIRQIA